MKTRTQSSTRSRTTRATTQPAVDGAAPRPARTADATATPTVRRTKATATKAAAPKATAPKATATAADAATDSVATPKRGVAGKLVRDKFSMPVEDHDLIKFLKQRAEQAGRPTRKNELLRAGLHALRESGTVELIRSLERLAPLRRKGSKSSKNTESID